MTVPFARLPPPHGAARGEDVSVTIDGRKVRAYRGESVATVLLAEGLLELRTTAAGEPRGLFCGMGVCFDCIVVVDGVPGTRSCVTWVSEGMTVTPQDGFGPRTTDGVTG